MISFQPLISKHNSRLNTGRELDIQIQTTNCSFIYEWDYNIDGGHDFIDEGKDVVVDGNGYAYFTGYVHDQVTSYDVILIKYSQDGTELWKQFFKRGGASVEKGYAITADTQNNIYVTGEQYANATYDYQVLLLKYDSNGQKIWNQSWGGTGTEKGFDIVVSNGYIYITGTSDSAGTDDIIILKYDTDGNLIWSKIWDGGSNDISRGIVVAGNLIFIVGDSDSYTGGDLDVILMKFLDDGNNAYLLWNKTWGGSNTEYGYDIGLDNDGYIYITGYTESYGLGSSEIFLIKYNSDGNLIWARLWGGLEWDRAYALTVDQEDNIYVTGATKSYPSFGYWSIIILQYDTAGNQPCHAIWGRFDYNYGYGIAVYENNLYIAGRANWAGVGNITFAKFRIPQQYSSAGPTNAIPGLEYPFTVFSLLVLTMIFLLIRRKNSIKIS